MSRHLKTISIIAGLALALGAAAAHAQTFTASKLTGESPLTTVLTWSQPGAGTCTASGHAQWSGSVPTSGTRTLTGLTTSTQLKLDCNGPAVTNKFRLKWTRVTQNTDGSAISNLGGYLIEYGPSTTTMTQTRDVPLASVETITPSVGNPQDSAYTMDGLAAGTWFAQIKARNTACFPSTSNCRESVASSPPVSQTITTSPGPALPQLSVTIDPFQVPKAPTGVVATEVTAYLIEQVGSGALVATRIEMTPVSTSCDGDHCTVLTRLASGEVQR